MKKEIEEIKMNYEVQDFQKEVIERSKNIPVLVDFWAEWCGPCKMLGPILERLAEKYKDIWALAKLDTDNNQEIAMEYGIRGIPNVKLFVNGNVADEFTGALPENMVEQWWPILLRSTFSTIFLIAPCQSYGLETVLRFWSRRLELKWTD